MEWQRLSNLWARPWAIFGQIEAPSFLPKASGKYAVGGCKLINPIGRSGLSTKPAGTAGLYIETGNRAANYRR